MDFELRLRVTLLDPLPDVVYALQSGPTATRELLPPIRSSKSKLVFETTVRVVAATADKTTRFRGPTVHGPTDDRFLYINTGKQAGQMHTLWDRRLKVRVGSITPALLKSVANKPNAVLEAVLPGRGKDGGPSCATVPFISDWSLASA